MSVLNRRDPKWGHPESVEAGTWCFDDIMGAYIGIDQKSTEELDEAQKVAADQSREMFSSLCEPEWLESADWKDYYTEKGCPEEPEANTRLMVRIPKDRAAGEKLPCIFTIAGGGMAGGGAPENTWHFNNEIGYAHNAIIVSPQYRVAPGHPAPASINDCHATFIWMLDHADELGIDVNRVILWGGSTGGHLVLSLAFRLKRYDYHGIRLRGVISVTPVMDDGSGLFQSNRYSFRSEENGGRIDSWDADSNRMCLKWWLGDDFGNAKLPAELLPSHITLEDAKGYPPTWFPVCAEFDAGRDATYKFVSTLHQAGVFCDLHMWGGGSHQVMNGHTPLTERIWIIIHGAIRDALTYDFTRPWLDEE